MNEVGFHPRPAQALRVPQCVEDAFADVWVFDRSGGADQVIEYLAHLDQRS